MRRYGGWEVMVSEGEKFFVTDLGFLMSPDREFVGDQ